MTTKASQQTEPFRPEDDSANQNNSQEPSSNRLIVAGIGASAGGIEALRAFFEALPENLGVAFVVIIHLSPEHRSHLAEILAACTSMPVEQVHNSVSLEGNHIYVIPPDRRLEITNSQIGAFPFEEPRGQRAPIDLFFRSLAQQHGDGFAVILSGGGSDGAVGVKAVKEQGGLILVQDPHEAVAPSMPRAAIATGVADVILPVRELAVQLADLTHTKRRIAQTLVPERAAGLDNDSEQMLTRILAHLYSRTGHDFFLYKQATVLRRLSRRMQVHHKETLGDYLAFLRQNMEEVQALFDELLISVTTFFRDPAAFEALQAKIITPLFETKTEDHTLRIWVPGCATGEEAYSLAILVLEEATRRDVWPRVQIFASDLDEGALTTARDGRYPAAIEADVSPERLQRFFVKEEDHYRINKEVRELVLFATHSLIKDPPFSRLDLISCRNLLIYLDRKLQAQVFSLLRYALRPDGYLFVGASENAEGPYFRLLDKKYHLYQARALTGSEPLRLPDPFLSARRIPAEPERTRPKPLPAPALHQKLLETLAPPSILVGENRLVLHLSETAGRFLQPPGGPFTQDITELVRPELQLELHTALYQALERDESILSPFVPIRFDGTSRRVAILVQPKRGEDNERQVLVMFLEGGEEVPAEVLQASGEVPAEVVNRLQAALYQSEERVRTTREEQETANEELRTANEELQSLNEEYRSTAEELETSKEELQSLNEELETVNNELKNKLEEIAQAHNDLENLIAASEIGILFLDRQLRIHRFTPPLIDLFNITANDRGRSISDFTHRLRYNRLEADARQIINELPLLEREVQSVTERWYLVRLRPYRMANNKIDGVNITFVEITQLKQAKEDLKEINETLETRVAERTEEVHRQHEQLRGLTQRLTEVQEAERKRIAQDLHDQMGPNLTALGLNLNIIAAQVAQTGPENNLLQVRLNDSLALIEQATEIIRAVMADLRPPVLDDYGLLAALKWYIAQLTTRLDLSITLQAEELKTRLPLLLENVLFRIAQEALANIIKHAQATQATVTVEADEDMVCLTVADNGIGFEFNKLPKFNDRANWGLLTMTERAEGVGGQCRIESAPGAGTKVIVQVRQAGVPSTGSEG